MSSLTKCPKNLKQKILPFLPTSVASYPTPNGCLDHPSNLFLLLRYPEVGIQRNPFWSRGNVSLMMNLHCPTQGPFSICTLKFLLSSHKKCCATIAVSDSSTTHSLYCERQFHDVESTIFVKGMI